MTGVSLLVIELVPKRLEFLIELVPEATVIGGLINPKNSNAGRNMAAIQHATRKKTAAALSLAVPPIVLARADDVIE